MNDPASRKFWKKLQGHAHQTLGDQFWQDIAGLVPTQGPRVDVYETADRVVAVVELPGWKETYPLKLSVHKNVLHIKGDMPCTYPVDEDELRVSERFFGQFHRKIALPSGVATAGMRARYENGLLTVEFAKAKEADQAIDLTVEYVNDSGKKGGERP